MGRDLPEDLSTMTVVKLKEFCKENGLSVSGNKSDLIDRITAHNSEESISLEESENVPLPVVDDDDVLDAEVLDAEVIEDTTENLSNFESGLPTLLDQIKNPKAIAILLTLLVVSGGWYWYASNQLQPFVADDLRYGDSMEYTVSNGNMEATGGYIELVLDNVELEDEDICRLKVNFNGTGTTEVTKGTSEDIIFESDDSLLGNVQAKGSYGLDWLAVEKKQTKDFDTFNVIRYKENIQSPGKCLSNGASAGGSMQFDLTTWTEIAERDVISTRANWNLGLDGEVFEGTTVSFGIGGVLGALESIAPGVAMVISPIELREMMGGTLIEEDANGIHLGWEWRVTGSDEIGGEDYWKVSMEHREIRDNCFGFARINMWAAEESPWAIKQSAEIKISDADNNQNSCSTWTGQLADLVLPDGELSFSVEMSKDSLTRGDKLLTLGRSYSSMPNSGAYAPKSSELSNWGENDIHLPDNSTMRQNTLENAVDCLTSNSFGNLNTTLQATTALNNDGYIWRARNNASLTPGFTAWNLSWVNTESISGWVELEVSGTASESNCTYINHNSHDDSNTHKRNDIPSALNLSMIEDDLSDQLRFPELTGPDGFFTTSGDYHPETRIGYLVVTPQGELTDWINRLNSGDTGATTVDLYRQWDKSVYNGQVEIVWENSLSLILDATTGQVVGWNHIATPVLGD